MSPWRFGLPVPLAPETSDQRIQSSTDCLQGLAQVVRRVLGINSPGYPWIPIAKHMRHLLDRYSCFHHTGCCGGVKRVVLLRLTLRVWPLHVRRSRLVTGAPPYSTTQGQIAAFRASSRIGRSLSAIGRTARPRYPARPMAASRPCSRSANRSASLSSPIESRTRQSLIPAARLTSGLMLAWVIVPG